jgi:hypothetical protein
MIKVIRTIIIAMKQVKLSGVFAIFLIATPTTALATLINGTGLVTPDVIFGSGNGNGSFTGETNNNIEVALRAKQRYPKADVFNYDGIDTYTFDSLLLTTNPANRSVFNFEWSINVDQSGTSGLHLSDFRYMFSFDTDPTALVSYSNFDPFNVPGFFDHSLGDNTTANGGGIESASNAELSANMSQYSVAQQSANLGFGYSVDPDLPGIYNFRMDVMGSQSDEVLSSAEISVIVTPVAVPLPATLPLMLGGLALISFMSRRRKV